MIYTSVSISEVIGRIIMGTNLQDASLIHRFGEWIPQAMGYMRTKTTLSPRWACVPIEYHKGRLPCGLRNVLAVEWNGQRLSHYNGQRAFDAPPTGTGNSEPTLFGTFFVPRETPEGGIITETDLQAIRNLPVCGASYFTELDWINTSFPDGYVIVHFMAMPTDEAGFPLIPDNEDYKQAIYWYCRNMLIGAGYKDPAYTPQYCDQKFEVHAARALGQLRQRSVDQAEAVMKSTVRLILPDNYWENYFGEKISGSKAAPATNNSTNLSDTLGNGWDQTDW